MKVKVAEFFGGGAPFPRPSTFGGLFWLQKWHLGSEIWLLLEERQRKHPIWGQVEKLWGVLTKAYVWHERDILNHASAHKISRSMAKLAAKKHTSCHPSLSWRSTMMTMTITSDQAWHWHFMVEQPFNCFRGRKWSSFQRLSTHQIALSVAWLETSGVSWRPESMTVVETAALGSFQRFPEAPKPWKLKEIEPGFRQSCLAQPKKHSWSSWFRSVICSRT